PDAEVAREGELVDAEPAEHGVQDQIAFDVVVERLPGRGLGGIGRALVQPEQLWRDLDPSQSRGGGADGDAPPSEAADEAGLLELREGLLHRGAAPPGEVGEPARAGPRAP